MATRFTRVTVVADERNLDVSLPADRPAHELVPQICDLLSLPPQPAGPWSLATVAAGSLDPRRSLADSGIIDADVLYLTPPQDAPPPPVVDDVIDATGSTVDDTGGRWEGDIRGPGCAALAGIALLALTAAVPFMPLTRTGLVAMLADVAVLAAVGGGALRGRGGEFLLAAAVPAWTLTGVEVAVLAGWPRLALFTAAVAGAGTGAAAFALAGRRWSALVTGGALAALCGVLGTGLAAAGLDPAEVAAVLAVFTVFAVGLVPQLGLSRSGLVDLLRREEAGQPVDRQRVTSAVRDGRAALTGAVCGIAAVAAGACAVLVTSAEAAGVALGGLLGLVFALRSRLFTSIGQVWPMLVPAVVTTAVALVAVPSWLQAPEPVAAWVTFGGSLVLAGLLVLAGRARLDAVAASRLRQVLDVTEVIAVVALVPLVIAVFGGFAWALR